MIWSVQNTEQIQAVGEIKHSKSDRAVAIVCGAIVEQRLELSLKWRLRPHDSTHKRLFKPSGPLGPFGNKVDLGFLLYMYDKPTWQALNSICQNRNKFAHNLSQSFSYPDKELEIAIRGLTLHEGVKFYPLPFSSKSGDTKEKIRKPTNNKQMFVRNVKLALIVLMRDFDAHAPQSNQTITPPEGTRFNFTPQRVHYLVPRAGKRKKTLAAQRSSAFMRGR